MKEKFSFFVNFLFKKRFLFVFLLFVLCVFFEISGSSIGLWCSYFGEEDKDILLGVSRPIRSDEWAVFTPMGISQYYNYSGSFPYFSNTVRGCTTDVFLEYGQAVKNLLVIFRPFYWGYLFLPVAKGISFFWCGRLLALLMVSLEFGLLITNKRKLLSLTMAIMITFAPTVQWWFSINGLVEMLIYIQLSIIMLQKYMTDSRFTFRLLYLFVIVICAGGYVLTFYPSWMIPCAYILLALAIWIFLENRKNCKMHISDWISICGSVLIFAFSMMYFYHMSKNTITSLMNTVYPGSRFETGGGMLNFLFLYITNIWHTVLGNGAWGNVCESSYFIDFFPVCWILPILTLLRSQKKDILLQLLLFVSFFLGVYCIFGFPKTLSKISLLSNCQAGRVLVAFGFCNVLLLIRTLSQSSSVYSSSFRAASVAFVAILIAVQACKALNPNFLYKNKVMLFGTILVFFILYICLLSYKSKKQFVWMYGAIAITLFSSFLANPIRHGIKSVENISILKTWKEIHLQEPDAKWMIDNCGFPINNSGLLVGIPTINSTNVYPSLDRWHLIDPERNNETVYNRYAHISMKLEDVPTASFDLISPDQFSCTLSISDARKLGVSYVMSNRDLHSYDLRGDLMFLDEKNGFYFYKIQDTPHLYQDNEVSVSNLQIDTIDYMFEGAEDIN